MMHSMRAQGKCQLCLQFLEKQPMVAPFLSHLLQRILRPRRQADPTPARTPSPRRVVSLRRPARALVVHPCVVSLVHLDQRELPEAVVCPPQEAHRRRIDPGLAREPWRKRRRRGAPSESVVAIHGARGNETSSDDVAGLSNAYRRNHRCPSVGDPRRTSC